MFPIWGGVMGRGGNRLRFWYLWDNYRRNHG